MSVPAYGGSLLHRLRAERGPLIMAHRGTASGSIAENTPEAVLAAVASGADLVEIDVSASSDGQFFAFHDGAESRLLGEDIDLLSMTAEQIHRLRLLHTDRPDKPARVPLLEEVLDALPSGVPVNIDRSWPWWDRFLPWLDRREDIGSLLLKCPAWDRRALGLLRGHARPYPFIPICRTLAQAEALASDPELNTVGVELIASEPGHPALDRERLLRLKRSAGAGSASCQELLILVNAEVLTDGVPLFGGYDDELAVLGSPAQGWGPLFELGADIIQTDWPWLLHAHRREVLHGS